MFFFIAQISFFKSIDMATNIGRASMINYSQVAIGYFIEIFFYGEVPRILQGFGVVAIIFGLGLIMLK
jgi:drug/metabolite transporter (DMT)-like permease